MDFIFFTSVLRIFSFKLNYYDSYGCNDNNHDHDLDDDNDNDDNSDCRFLFVRMLMKIIDYVI